MYLSIRNPPIIGSTTFGQEYQEYRLANPDVVIFMASYLVIRKFNYA